MRCYQTASGPAVFRLDAHLERFFQSAAAYEMTIPYSIDQLAESTLALVRANRMENAYLRPIAFFDASTLAVWTRECPVTVAIAGFPTSKYLANADQGVRVLISSIRKYPSNAIPSTAKACGQYINSARAVQEAQRKGFDEAILLNQRGEVSEGSGENIFVVKNGAILTNDASADILMGVTRDTILQLARDLGIRTDVGAMTVDDLMSADELFFSGTAVEVTPIREIDGHVVGGGQPGPVTSRLRETFESIVRGKKPEYRKWLSFATEAVTAP
jgi:branched-chain amino acid aminotransferase